MSFSTPYCMSQPELAKLRLKELSDADLLQLTKSLYKVLVLFQKKQDDKQKIKIDLIVL